MMQWREILCHMVSIYPVGENEATALVETFSSKTRIGINCRCVGPHEQIEEALARSMRHALIRTVFFHQLAVSLYLQLRDLSC